MMRTVDFFSLEGKTAIVTGGFTGLGLAITECMAGAGAKVVVLSRKALSECPEALKEYGDKITAYPFDVTDTEHTQEIVNRIISEQGPVSILVNNAGNHCKKWIEDMTVEEYKNVLDVHLVGAFALTKALFPHMKEQGGGSVIFQASMSSYIGLTQVAGYATAKAGYLGLMHTLAAEGGNKGVRVNAIAPGWIDTPMFHKATDGDIERQGKILGRIPLEKVGDPTDIGMAAVFLASDAAKYITGACLPVDGGALIGF